MGVGEGAYGGVSSSSGAAFRSSNTGIFFDVNTRPGLSSSPQHLTACCGLLFFSAVDFRFGRELWVTDGGSDGTGSVPMKGEGKTTRMVKDVWRTWDGVGSDPYDLTCVGSSGSAASVLYFAANDGVHGVELWRSDGTEGGTRPWRNPAASTGGRPQKKVPRVQATWVSQL